LTLSAKALCTLALVETELGITAGSDTTRLERIIESVSGEIAKYCGAPSFHYESARADDIRGYGTPAIHTSKRPLLSIGSIVYDPQDMNSTVDSDLYLIDNADEGRIYRDGGWIWTAAYGQYITTFPLGGTEESLYRVTYEGGYRTRNQVTGTLDGKLDGAAVTSVVINETVPTDTPATGTIKVFRDDGTLTEFEYTSWTGKTFTIPSTDFSGNEAADGNAVEMTVNLTLPEDLEDAAIMYASMRYLWGPRNPAVISEKLGSWAATYASNKIVATGMPVEVAARLGPYVRPVWA